MALPTNTIWGGATCFLTGVCWIAYSVFSLIVQPHYWDPASGLDYLSVALYSGALLSLAGGLVALYSYIRRIGRAHWVGTLGFVLAIAGATLAGVGNLLEDGLGVSVMGWIVYVPGILALLAGLLVAAIIMLVTRTLPAIYGVIFLLGAVALPFLTSGGGIALGASWLALGVFFLTSAAGQPGLSSVRRTA
jgi:hypothetical protein